MDKTDQMPIFQSDNLKTPKVLDNFVFDILPPHPTTPKHLRTSAAAGSSSGPGDLSPNPSLAAAAAARTRSLQAANDSGSTIVDGLILFISF